jgi:uncharacterized protein
LVFDCHGQLTSLEKDARGCTDLTLTEFLSYVPFVRVFVRQTGTIAQPDSAEQQAPADLKRALRKGRKSRVLAMIVEGVSLFGLYMALSPVFAMPMYNAVIFRPWLENIDLSGPIKKIEKMFQCQYKEVSIKSPNGEKLNGWYFKIPGARKTILVSHGNAGNIQHRLELCPLLLSTGCSVLLYDYEGYGKSTGHPSLPNVCVDAIAAFDYLTNDEHVQPSDVIIYGESIGCGVTSELSRKRPAGAIILQSPFTSLPACGADKLPFMRLYPDWIFPSPHLDNLGIMKDAHPPLLIIHGKKDSILPYQYSERIMAEAAEPKTLVLLPDAGHNDVCCVNVQQSMEALKKFVAGLR